MSDSMREALVAAQDVAQRLAMAVIALSALGLGILSAAAALGHLPWLDLTLTFGGIDYPRAGMAVQLAATALMLSLCIYLPANARILRLENSHRSFHIGMTDVARAYAAAHRADRAGVFELASEFDSVRERLAHLRAHPDLGHLEPAIIEVAAQMSHVSRDLARTYSDRNVARARDFLVQRQQEIEEFTERLAEAKAITTELKRWHDRVELEEAVARSQLDWLRDELAEVMPEILAPASQAAETGPASAGQAADLAPDSVAPHRPAADVDPDGDDPEADARYAGDPRIVELLQRRAQR